jgi:hypothetical protein
MRRPRPPLPSCGCCRARITGARAGARRIPRMVLDGRVPRRHAWSKGGGMACRAPSTSALRSEPASARSRAGACS